MPIYATNEGEKFSQAPEGVHRASCVGIYDLGTQDGGQFGPRRKVLIQWELADELMEDGRPFIVSERYTLSTNEKSNLRHKLDAWRGTPLTEAEARRFDVTVLLGKPCMLQLAHKQGTGGKTYANITSIMAMGKHTPKPEKIHNPLRQFSIDDPSIPEGTPKWISDVIHASHEYTGRGFKPGFPEEEPQRQQLQPQQQTQPQGRPASSQPQSRQWQTQPSTGTTFVAADDDEQPDDDIPF